MRKFTQAMAVAQEFRTPNKSIKSPFNPEEIANCQVNGSASGIDTCVKTNANGSRRETRAMIVGAYGHTFVAAEPEQGVFEECNGRIINRKPLFTGTHHACVRFIMAENHRDLAKGEIRRNLCISDNESDFHAGPRQGAYRKDAFGNWHRVMVPMQQVHIGTRDDGSAIRKWV